VLFSASNEPNANYDKFAIPKGNTRPDFSKPLIAQGPRNPVLGCHDLL
jgi:hypothetical protein